MTAAEITMEQAESANFQRGEGCNYCNKTGYRGRIAIYEIMRVTAKIRELMFEGASSTEIREVAIEEGMHTLYQDGIDKVLQGTTTLEEVFRIAKKTEQDILDEVVGDSEPPAEADETAE